MRFKAGVVMYRINSWLEDAFPTIDAISREIVGRDAMVTSARDGIHSSNSLHYQGRAIDLRIRDIADASLKWRYRDRLAEALGEDFDVVMETDHIHVELDP